MSFSKRIILVVFLLLNLPGLLPANEFWLQPERHICKRGETINIRFHIGDGFSGHNWRGNSTRIKALKFYMGNLRDDLSENLSLDQGDSLQLEMFDEGTGMISFQSTNTFIKIPAKKFNAYLRDEALGNAIAFRLKNDEMDEAGQEQYQRNAKTLFQVGAKMNTCYKQPTGMPLDIIPQSNPFSLRNNQSMTVKVLFQGKPVANKCIKLWHRVKSNTVLQDLVTSKTGEIKFRLQKTGRWMISTVAIERLPRRASADWQSYFGSLTWGYAR